ncbi:IS110 family transposase [Opitutus terrae]|uniref:IS110 family transposase n=1 Tax=Opitutus terrae TaxID=107709 RepID=UPI000694591F|nr:IS110 family transposase [Opitutus terrae]
MTEDPAVLGPAELYLHALLAQLEPLLVVLERYDERIAQVFGAHPDQALIRSFPGVGPVLAPRLLAALGDDRSRFPAAKSLQCLSGIAPVVIRSGHSTQICRRHALPHLPAPVVPRTRQRKHPPLALGPRLLRAAKATRQETPHHRPRPRLQMAADPRPLLAGPSAV